MHASVRDIMTTGVVTVRPDTSVRELAVKFASTGQRFPVTPATGRSSAWCRGRPAGWRPGGTTRTRSDGQATAGDLMTHPAVTISRTTVQTAPA